MIEEDEDYSIFFLFAYIIFWLAWYRILEDFWFSGGITTVTFIIGYLIYKLWNL